MKYKKIDKVPIFKKRRNDLRSFFESFLEKKIPWVEVLYAPGEYKTPRSAYSSLWKSAKKNKYPVAVRYYHQKIYLVNETLQENE